MSPGQAFTEKYLKVMFSSLKDATPEEVQEEMVRCRNINRKPVRVPKIHKARFSEHWFQATNGFNMQVFSSEPYSDPDTLIVYVHGGACIYQPVFFHWRFVHDLAIRTHCQVLMPLYPKYPEYHCVDDMAVMMDFYERYVMPMQAKRVVLMGDSFGGNVAMAMTQEISHRGWQPVSALVMISPCVDHTYTRREAMKALQPLDQMIKLERIESLMGGWQGKLPPTHPWVSPIYGDLTVLPSNTLLIYGSNEILKVDAELLVEKMKEMGRPIKALEYQGMFHTFPLFPIRQGFDAIAVIAREVRPKQSISRDLWIASLCSQ